MLAPQADRLLRTDWQATFGDRAVEALAQECHALFSVRGPLKHAGGAKLLGDVTSTMSDVDVRALRWGLVAGQGFAAENQSYVDVRQTAGKQGGLFGAIRRVFQTGMGLIGGVESAPVDYTDGSIVGFQLDQQGHPYVQTGNGDTPAFRVCVTAEKLKSGGMPMPHGPFSATLLRTPDGGATWTETGEEIQVYNPTGDKVTAGTRALVLKDPTQDYYLYWQPCEGAIRPSETPPVVPCVCGGADPSSLLDTVGLGTSTVCTDSPTPTVASKEVTPLVTNLPACLKVKFTGLINRCCEECIDYFNLQDDCYLYFVHRSAFAVDPGAVDTGGHGLGGVGMQSDDQWFLVKDASPVTAALLHEITLKGTADPDQCTLCKIINDETGGWPENMQAVIYPTFEHLMVCMAIGLPFYTGGGAQDFNPGSEMLFVLQIGPGDTNNLAGLWYYTLPLGGDSTGGTVVTPLDMATLGEMTFVARCANGYWGMSDPNEPPQIGYEPALGFYSDSWPNGPGCYVDDGFGGYDQHPLGVNYNCRHMDNSASLDPADGPEYYGAYGEFGVFQCVDGTLANTPDLGHNCATAVATWAV